jgi:hypothetical protein
MPKCLILWRMISSLENHICASRFQLLRSSHQQTPIATMAVTSTSSRIVKRNMGGLLVVWLCRRQAGREEPNDGVKGSLNSLLIFNRELNAELGFNFTNEIDRI